jgi:hypothetical protein
MADTGTYVYCLVAGERRPLVRRRFDRPPGMGPLRLLQVDKRLWLVVADAELKVYGAERINQKLSDLDWVSRAAVGHEAVVEAFSARQTTLPMKLFTIFNSDDRAVEQIHRDRRRVDAAIVRVANHSEWGVRVTFEPPAPSRARRPAVRAGHAKMSGARYLSQKKAQRDMAFERAERASETVRELYRRLGAKAKLSRRRSAAELPIQGGPLLLDAAFLVARARATAFRSLAAREARRLERRGYHVALTGPWPPYTFVKD